MSSGYGYCPKCGAPGVSRERRLNGNDMCEAGHTYPSSEATPTPNLHLLDPSLRMGCWHCGRPMIWGSDQEDMCDPERIVSHFSCQCGAAAEFTHPTNEEITNERN